MFVQLVNISILHVDLLLLTHIFYLGGNGKRKKRDAESVKPNEEGENKKNTKAEDNKNHNGGASGTKKVEPSLDRVFVPWKKAIYEARKQLLRASVKSNFNKLDLITSYPHLFEILWYVSFL